MTDRSSIVQEIIFEALQKIHTDYADLAYHNVDHTRAVLEATLELANDLKLSSNDRDLLQIAAAAHDVIQDTDPLSPGYNGQNEKSSAAWATKQMKKANLFSSEEIDQIKRAILATTIKHREDGLTQSAESGDLLSEILCDADLAGLGSPWEIYLKHMEAYFDELHPNATEDEWEHFLRLQVPILRQHHYYTTVAQQRFHHLRENAERIEGIVTKN